MKDKRKVFNDAIDFLTADAPEGGVSMVSVDAITPFRDHPFKLYQGDRLNDMVESIKEHGILTPGIVRKLGSGYEMLAGHNRHNAAKLAGLTEMCGTCTLWRFRTEIWSSPSTNTMLPIHITRTQNVVHWEKQFEI